MYINQGKIILNYIILICQIILGKKLVLHIFIVDFQNVYDVLNDK